MRRDWCDSCRGEAEDGEDLKECSKCPRKFHVECCAGLKGAGKEWACPHCVADTGAAGDKTAELAAADQTKLVRVAHAGLKDRACVFFERERASLSPFVPAARLNKMRSGKAAAERLKAVVPPIGPSESYITAELRPYQVAGVNWIIAQYNLGTVRCCGNSCS